LQVTFPHLHLTAEDLKDVGIGIVGHRRMPATIDVGASAFVPPGAPDAPVAVAVASDGPALFWATRCGAAATGAEDACTA
jgi:hypothetical protein